MHCIRVRLAKSYKHLNQHLKVKLWIYQACYNFHVNIVGQSPVTHPFLLNLLLLMDCEVAALYFYVLNLRLHENMLQAVSYSLLKPAGWHYTLMVVMINLSEDRSSIIFFNTLFFNLSADKLNCSSNPWRF